MSFLPGRAVGKSLKRSWLRHEWRLLVGMGLSAVCLYLALRGISLPALLGAFSIVRWEWVAMAVTVVVFSTIAKALRWRSLFLPQRIPLGKVWSVFMIGQMLNVVLPARAGEVGRLYFIGRGRNVSRAKALSTVVVEKAVDLVMLALAYLVVAAWLAAAPAEFPPWLGDAGVGLLPLAALALVGLLVLVYAGRPAWQIVRHTLRLLPQDWRVATGAAAEQAVAAFEALRRWQVSAQVWGWSLFIWVLATLNNCLVFAAFGFSLSPSVALLLLVVLMSGVSVPPLPGNLGVFPYLCLLVLSLFGIDREVALACGIVLQVVTYLPLIVLGMASLLGQNRSLRRPFEPCDKVGNGDVQV